MSHMCLPPDQTGWRLRAAGGQSSSTLHVLLLPPPPHPQTGNLMPVPWSCLPGIQRLKQVSSRFKVGSACAAVLWPVFMFCFSLMLMTVKPQRPPAWIRRVLTQPLFTQAHNKSTTFLGREIRTHQGGDNGERFSLGLFRFSLDARLDNTSACTKGATTECFSRFVWCSGVFWLLIRGKSQEPNTSSMLNNPLSQLLSLITNYSENTSLGNTLHTTVIEIGLNPKKHFQTAVPHPSTYYLQSGAQCKPEPPQSKRLNLDPLATLTTFLLRRTNGREDILPKETLQSDQTAM